MEQREPDLSGDYEYDLAHEQTVPAQPVQGTVNPHRQQPPVGRSVEYAHDMSYDEAHDF